MLDNFGTSRFLYRADLGAASHVHIYLFGHKCHGSAKLSPADKWPPAGCWLQPSLPYCRPWHPNRFHWIHRRMTNSRRLVMAAQSWAQNHHHLSLFVCYSIICIIWEWWQCVSGRGSTLIRWVAEKVTLVFCSGKFPSSHSPPSSSSSSSSSSWHLHSASTFAKTTWYVLCKKGNFARKSDWQCIWPGIFYSVRGACQCSFLPEGEGGWWGRRKVKLERLCQRPTIPSVIYE